MPESAWQITSDRQDTGNFFHSTSHTESLHFFFCCFSKLPCFYNMLSQCELHKRRLIGSDVKHFWQKGLPLWQLNRFSSKDWSQVGGGYQQVCTGEVVHMEPSRIMTGVVLQTTNAILYTAWELLHGKTMANENKFILYSTKLYCHQDAHWYKYFLLGLYYMRNAVSDKLASDEILNQMFGT